MSSTYCLHSGVECRILEFIISTGSLAVPRFVICGYLITVSVMVESAKRTMDLDISEVRFMTYSHERQLPLLQRLIDEDLSEPYSVFTYRYFLNTWPHLCLLAMLPDNETCIGTVVGKVDTDRKGRRRGYIAMLDVDKRCRKHGHGKMISWHFLMIMPNVEFPPEQEAN